MKKTQVVDNKDITPEVVDIIPAVTPAVIPLKIDKIKQLIIAKEIALKAGKKVEAKKIRRQLRTLGFYSSESVVAGNKIVAKSEEGEEVEAIEEVDIEVEAVEEEVEEIE